MNRHNHACSARQSTKTKAIFRSEAFPSPSILSIVVIAFIALASATARLCVAQETPAYTRKQDVIYGYRFGTARTLDVFQPQATNGCALIYVVSGGFFSSREAINPKFYEPLLKRGYTVIAAVHGSQPKFHIPEIELDIHRAVRWVRHNAVSLGINPMKIGILGASAGGHLSLTMGVQGRAGDPEARDVVDRQSSVVQAVACFFPPTDFLNWSKPGDDAVGVGTLKDFGPAFGPRRFDDQDRAKLGREISPIYFVSSNSAPSLIIHGDADKLVPIYQAEQFAKRCKELGVPVKIEVRPGKEHGWPGIEKDIDVLADWFDQHLRGLKPAS